jgi:hypothetical protein
MTAVDLIIITFATGAFTAGPAVLLAFVFARLLAK